ncbi:MAG: glutamyl-tRNA reductase [Gemmatimonadota bacterium]
MSLAIVGVNHSTAPIEVRERFAFGMHEVPQALAELFAEEGVAEAVLLSTCNRTEVCLVEAGGGIARAATLLERKAGVLPRPASSYLYQHRDLDAVRHLFRVVSSLDSMILGEAQIQGQVKDAYERSRGVAHGGRSVVGAVLHRLFQAALSVGGRVRSETRVAEGAASVPLAAVELARKIFGSLHGRRVMVVGAGEMGELSVRCLVEDGVEVAILTNRHVQRAQRLAERYGGRTVLYEEFWRELPTVDLVVASSAAPHPILTLDRVRDVLPQPPGRPLCILDIAIPRDVEPAVGELPNVFLYNVDDLKHVVTANLDRRRGELPKAERLIDAAASEFWRWYVALEAVPLIRRLREHAESLRLEEWSRWRSQLAHLSAEDREHVERLTQGLLKKLLHGPTVRIREAAENGRGAELLDAARTLFDIDPTDEPSA